PTSLSFSSARRHRPPLHSFPTRRSSDLQRRHLRAVRRPDPLVRCEVRDRDDLVRERALGGRAAGALVRAGAELVELLAGELPARSEEHTSELQSQSNLVCRLLLEKKKK